MLVANQKTGGTKSFFFFFFSVVCRLSAVIIRPVASLGTCGIISRSVRDIYRVRSGNGLPLYEQCRYYCWLWRLYRALCSGDHCYTTIIRLTAVLLLCMVILLAAKRALLRAAARALETVDNESHEPHGREKTTFSRPF